MAARLREARLPCDGAQDAPRLAAAMARNDRLVRERGSVVAGELPGLGARSRIGANSQKRLLRGSFSYEGLPYRKDP